MEKCNSYRRSAERFTEAALIVLLLLISISALGVSLSFEWAKVDLYQPASSDCPCTCTEAPCTDPCCQSKGYLRLGLFELQQYVMRPSQFTPEIRRYAIFDDEIAIDNSALPVVVACSLASAVLSFVCLFFAGINIWFDTKSIFYGPTVIYLLCFFSSIFSITALAAYLDFYIWTLRDGIDLIPHKYNHLFENGQPYIQLAGLYWAFYVHAGGTGCSVIAFVLACRVAAVVMSTKPPPARQHEDVKIPLSTLNSPYDVIKKDLSKHDNDDENSLNELENEPYFSDKSGASETGEQKETTLY